MKNPLRSGRVLQPTFVLFFFCLLLAGSHARAQITITANDFPHAGMLVVRNTDTTTTLSPGSAGLNQVWDFSNLVPSTDDSTLYTVPAGQPGIQNFPNTNLVEQDLDSDINYEGGYNFIFYETKPEGWYVEGQELMLSFFGINFRWHFSYQPPAVILPLPFTYNSSNNQSTNWVSYSGAVYNGAPVDTSKVVTHTNVTQTADASGTMITPEGSFEVLRVFQHVVMVDTTFDYNPSTGWVFSSTSSSVLDSYHWYANTIGEVGSLNVNGKKAGGSFSYYKSSTIVGESELPKPGGIKIFPVPAKDQLSLESDQRINRIEVCSISGVPLLSFGQENRLNISALTPGIYFLKAYSEGQLTTRKFIKQ